jgi:hypothetical protein
MTLEDHFRRAFAELTDRLGSEVSRQIATVAEELVAAAERDSGERVAAAVAAATAEQARQPPPVSTAHATSAHPSERLRDVVRALDAATSLSDILNTLVAYAADETQRAAVFVMRGGDLESWRMIGFGSDLDEPRRLHVLLGEAGPAAAAVRTRAVAVSGDRPHFAGDRAAGASVALPLLVAGDVVAVLYGDDGDADAAAPGTSSFGDRIASLEVVVRHAARCLEVMTALKSVQAARSTQAAFPGASAHSAAPGTVGSDVGRGGPASASRA